MYPPASDVGFTVQAELRNPTDRWYFPAPAESGYPASDVRPHYGDYEARPVPKKKMNLAEFLFNRLNDKNRRKPLKVRKDKQGQAVIIFATILKFMLYCRALKGFTVERQTQSSDLKGVDGEYTSMREYLNIKRSMNFTSIFSGM